MIIEREIRKMCVYINRQIPFINQGGCCVFAILLAKKLQKLGRVRIRCSDIKKRSLTTIRKELHNPLNINEWDNAGVMFEHVFVEFRYKNRTYHIDSEGIYHVDGRKANTPLMDNRYAVHAGELTLDEAEQFSKEPHAWNRMFNRRQIPKLEKLINECMTDILKSPLEMSYAYDQN